jgi:GH15 family glucan-1,4-alpha-glucosidase
MRQLNYMGKVEPYNYTKDTDILKSVWVVLRRQQIPVGFIDSETGLPKPSFDLWKKYGEHAYSSASVCAGLRSAVEIARILGEKQEDFSIWEETADSIKKQ